MNYLIEKKKKGELQIGRKGAEDPSAILSGVSGFLLHGTRGRSSRSGLCIWHLRPGLSSKTVFGITWEIQPFFILHTHFPHPARLNAVEQNSHTVHLSPGSLLRAVESSIPCPSPSHWYPWLYAGSQRGWLSNNTIILSITLGAKQTQTILLGELHLLVCSHLLSLAVRSLLLSILFLSPSFSHPVLPQAPLEHQWWHTDWREPKV